MTKENLRLALKETVSIQKYRRGDDITGKPRSTIESVSRWVYADTGEEITDLEQIAKLESQINED